MTVSSAPPLAAAISPARRSSSLRHPRRGEAEGTVPKGARWATLGFMLVIHILAAYALLPRFWSLPALASLLVLYWLTACLGNPWLPPLVKPQGLSAAAMAGALFCHLRRLKRPTRTDRLGRAASPPP